MQPHITWIVSYPKSGNTWLRFVIFWLHHRRLPHSSPELDAFASSRLPAYVAQAPDFCRSIRPRSADYDIDAPVYCKTHASAGAVAQLGARNRQAIYIVRHPLDVMQSALNYARLTGEIDPSDDGIQWTERFIENGGNPLWFSADYATGSWSANAEGWLDSPPLPTLFVRYEDLIADAEGNIRQIAAAVGHNISESIAAECAKATAFDRLRAFEQAEIAAARSAGQQVGRYSTPERLRAADTGAHFFNRGKSSSYHDVFEADQLERAWAVVEKAAVPLGYSFEAAAPAGTGSLMK
jgi:hypothetical protein